MTGDEDLIAAARIKLVHRLRSREAELQEAVFAHVSSVVPDSITNGDAQLAAGLREAIAVCVDCGLQSIEQGARWLGTIPPAVAAHARRNASSGVSLATALYRCVAGYTLVWNFVLGEVARNDLPDEQRFALLLQVSDATASLLAGVQAEIADAHSSEARSGEYSRRQRRVDVANKLLAGGSGDTVELAELGYGLDGWHLGVIATGAQAEKIVHGLAAGLGCELLLLVPDRETVWAWLGGTQQITFADVERIFSTADHVDVSLAIGEPGRGVKGWRQTHREAQGALLVARCLPRKLTRYLDVASDASALQDEALADLLIGTYLSPLDDMRIGGQAARRTLRALLEKAHKVSSAASALSVDRSTVHRQRNEIERRLGCQLHERQVEIAVALRVEDLRSRCDIKSLRTGPEATRCMP